MKSVLAIAGFLFVLKCAEAEIRSSALINRLNKVKVVGSPIVRKFMPLTEIPPPVTPSGKPVYHELPDGRRHLEADCNPKPEAREVMEGGHVAIFGDYYDDRMVKTVATVVIPDHIDRKFFEVTTQVPYLTVGPIEGIGYHATTLVQSECEKIYQDHLEDQYSDETRDLTEESLEMARMPFMAAGTMSPSAEQAENQYSDQMR